jgi:SAM-dependent methyltransferase
MYLAIIIIIIILLFFANGNSIVGGDDTTRVDNFKKNFDPIFKYKNFMTGEISSFKHQMNRYTDKNQVMQIVKMGNKVEVTRLMELLSKFIGIHPRNICSYLNKTDDEIKDLVVKNSKKLKKDSVVKDYIAEREINNNIKLYMMSRKILKAKQWSIYGKITNYLDFGCNNGYNTLAFGKVLGATNIYGCDIGKFDIPGDGQTNVIFNQVEDNKPLPYPDNHFEIISIIHVLHHVTNPSYLLKEFKRILKPNGIILLMDHIIWNDIDCMIVDIEHWLWNAVNGGKREEGDFTIKNYLNYINIGKIFADEKFVCIQAATMFYNFVEDPQPTKTFWGLFVKTDGDVDFKGYGTAYLDGDIKKYEKLVGRSLDDKL